MYNTKNNLPAMPFYVGDWFKCTEVRALPPDYRGLWFDMICYMWESTERGVMVKPNGKPFTEQEIIRMVGLDNKNSGDWLTRLLEDGICSKRHDGAIYSRRMVNDELLRQKRREIGLKGGNPKILVNHTLNRDVNYTLKKEVNQNTENENINTTKTTDKKTINNKDKYIEFVYMYKKEYKTLCDQYTKQKADEYIERLNLYIGSKGVKYKSHYHTILTWMRKEGLLPKKETSLPEPSKDCKVCFDPVAKKPSGWVYSREHGKNVPCKCRVG